MNVQERTQVSLQLGQFPRLARSHGDIRNTSVKPTLRKASSNVSEQYTSTFNWNDRLPTSIGSEESFQTVFIEPQARTGSSNEYDVEKLPSHAATNKAKGGKKWHTSSTEKPDQSLASCNHGEFNLFGRWLSTIRRRNRLAEVEPFLQRRSTDTRYKKDEQSNINLKPDRRSNNLSTPHSSSNGFINHVKSATVTLASASIRPQSWLGGRFDNLKRGPFLKSTRSSVECEDLFDAAAHMRSVQRRKILEEIVDSEEGYVADLKVLANVLFNLLVSANAFSSRFRASIRENITRLILLHETLLGALHVSIPHSEYSRCFARELPDVAPKGHTRWRSADGTPSYRKKTQSRRWTRHSMDLPIAAPDLPIATTADADLSLSVARIFEHSIESFFLYEEYSSMFDVLVHELSDTYSSEKSKESCEKGLEILARSLEATKLHSNENKKGLTLSDLVIKPIQRICKYPLLLSDLLKHTPIADHPVARAEIEKVYGRLQEVVENVNKAKDDPYKKVMIERTWCLYNMLERADLISQQLIHATMGQLRLCGALFVTYQSGSGPKGQYMMCALFKTSLVIATPDKTMTKFSVIAMICLSRTTLERADNGVGLQCYDAPFTWKVIFESSQSLFEFMFTACSADEEQQWRSLLKKFSDEEKRRGVMNPPNYSALSLRLGLDIKPLDSACDSGDLFFRNASYCGAAAPTLRSQIHQVILKNTASTGSTSRSSSEDDASISRSRSERRSPYIPVLAPRKLERIRLERALSDVWTKELLPFPAMKQARSDNPFRMSAGSVKRIFSMGGLASSFTRRATSNPGQPRARTPTTRQPLEFGMPLPRKRPSPTRPENNPPPSSIVPTPDTHAAENAVINFHDAPDKFLPPDFALPVSRPRKLVKTAPSTTRTVSDENRQDCAKHSTKKIEFDSKFRRPSSSRACSKNLIPVSSPEHAKVSLEEEKFTGAMMDCVQSKNDVAVPRPSWTAIKPFAARSASQGPCLGRTARLRKKIFL